MENANFKQGAGFQIYSGLLSEQHCSNLSFGITAEICSFIFGEQGFGLLQFYGQRAGRLATDLSFRKKEGLAGLQFRPGYSHDDRIAKKSGKSPLYLNSSLRVDVLCHPSLISILAKLYGTSNLVYANGLEGVIYKSGGCEESLPCLDCDYFSSFQTPESLENPYHYYGLFCLSRPEIETGENSVSDGSVMILEGFDRYYDLIRDIVGPNGKYPIQRKKNKNKSLTVLDNFNLEGVNSELEKIVPDRFVPLRWLKLDLQPGDFLVLDCRIPYKTTRNRYDQPSIYVPISLRPVNKLWYGSVKQLELEASLREGRVGNWRTRGVKDSNLHEYAWRFQLPKDHPFSLAVWTDHTNLSETEKLLFGLLPYAV